ncbi:MAG: LytR/AlgR family response regulator transcription factor [Pseudonocardiaceae bacterium]
MNEKPQRQDGPKDVLSDEFISIATAGGIVVVARSQVRWVEAKGDYVRLHTDKHNCLWRQSLASLEECWGGHGFVRIHNSFGVCSTSDETLEELFRLACNPGFRS